MKHDRTDRIGGCGARRGSPQPRSPTASGLAQRGELRQRLPDAIDRVEAWLNAHRKGVLGLIVNGLAAEAKVDSLAQKTQPPPQPQIQPPQQPARTDSISLP